MELAKRLKQLRKQNGFSQEQLAEVLGVSRQSISKWESELSVPEIDKIVQLSDIYGVTIDYLLKGTNPSFLKHETFYEDTDMKQPKKKYNPIIIAVICFILSKISLFILYVWMSFYPESPTLAVLNLNIFFEKYYFAGWLFKTGWSIAIAGIFLLLYYFVKVFWWILRLIDKKTQEV